MRHDGTVAGRPACTASGGGEDLGAGPRGGPGLRPSSGSAGPVILTEQRDEEEGGNAPPAAAGRALSSRGRARRRDWHGWRMRPREEGGLMTAASEPVPAATWDMPVAGLPRIITRRSSEPVRSATWEQVPRAQQQQQQQLERQPYWSLQGIAAGSAAGGPLAAVAEAPAMGSGAALVQQLEQMTGPPPPLSVANLVAWRCAYMFYNCFQCRDLPEYLCGPIIVLGMEAKVNVSARDGMRLLAATGRCSKRFLLNCCR